MSAALFAIAAIVLLGIGLWWTDRKPQAENKYNAELWQRTHQSEPTEAERKAIAEAGLTVEQWRAIKDRGDNNPYRP